MPYRFEFFLHQSARLHNSPQDVSKGNQATGPTSRNCYHVAFPKAHIYSLSNLLRSNQQWIQHMQPLCKRPGTRTALSLGGSSELANLEIKGWEVREIGALMPHNELASFITIV